MPARVVTPEYLIETNEHLYVRRSRDSEPILASREDIYKMLETSQGLYISACGDCTGTLIRVSWSAPSKYKRELENSPILNAMHDPVLEGFDVRDVRIHEDNILIIRSIDCGGGFPEYVEFIFVSRRLTRKEIEYIERLLPGGPRTRLDVYDAREPVIPYVPGLFKYVK